jgi:hypothetical protein
MEFSIEVVTFSCYHLLEKMLVPFSKPRFPTIMLRYSFIYVCFYIKWIFSFRPTNNFYLFRVPILFVSLVDLVRS